MILAEIYQDYYFTSSINENILYTKTLHYLFRLISSTQLCNYIYINTINTTKQEIKRWIKNKILFNGYLIKNIKLYLYNCILSNFNSDIANGKWLEIKYEDIELLSYLDNNLIEYLKYRPRDSNLITLNYINLLCEELWKENDFYIQAFVKRKLRFIYQSTGLDMEDIKNEMMCEGLRAVLHIFPNISSNLYAHNMFKRSALNYGKNMISKATTNKHARVINYNEYINTDYSDDNLSEIQQLDFKISNTLQYEINILNFKLSDKKRIFLSSLYSYNKDFTDWLIIKKIIHPSLDNEILITDMPIEYYIRLLAKWLDIKYTQALNFFYSLKKYFKDYSVKESY